MTLDPTARLTPTSDDARARLTRLAQGGDAHAWQALAKQCARSNDPLRLADAAPPWPSRADAVAACADALRGGCALTIGPYLAKPYKGDRWRGVECWLGDQLRERWWGGVGAEEQAAHWLLDQWLGPAPSAPTP
jgi:hypothetical protein